MIDLLDNITTEQEKEPVKVDASPLANPNDLDEFLAGYTSKPMDVNKVPEHLNPDNIIKRGRKKGQLKPGVRTPPLESMAITGELISGALFISLIDLIFPMIISFANNQFTKVKIKADQLSLTAQQKKDLEPICDQVVKHLKIEANPVTILVVSLAGIYGINYLSLKQIEEVKLSKQHNK